LIGVSIASFAVAEITEELIVESDENRVSFRLEELSDSIDGECIGETIGIRGFFVKVMQENCRGQAGSGLFA
jgi:hypothetical protein